VQVTNLTIEQAADALAESEPITRMDWGGNRLHVMVSATGRDFLLVQDDATGYALMIEGDEHDGESGGSIHNHARAMTGHVA
jgi:hypothetical protein